ncbi:hypothetical protein FB451DRAFT_1180504 [Mycena latifolia]|nr:hypothetical protein FB451DRAFT_1180504 [Mycena latifolia]
MWSRRHGGANDKFHVPMRAWACAGATRSIIRSRGFEGIQEKAESGEHRIRRTKTMASRVKADKSTVLNSGDVPDEGKPRTRRGATPGTRRGPAGVEQPRGVQCGCGVYAASAHRVLYEGDTVTGAGRLDVARRRSSGASASVQARRGREAKESARGMQAAWEAPAAEGVKNSECKAQRRAYTAAESHVPTRPGSMRCAELDGAAMRITRSELARTFIGGGSAFRIVASRPAQTIHARVYPSGMRRGSTRLYALCLDVCARSLSSIDKRIASQGIKSKIGEEGCRKTKGAHTRNEVVAEKKQRPAPRSDDAINAASLLSLQLSAPT